MKVTAAENYDVTTGNVGEVVNFTIKANAKAFAVLVDSLYSDKVRAVIRELCSNAFDAHIAAGNPDPFDLHLPTSFQPYFSVRDYGTSLSHENVLHLYTTVFESTKEDTNSQVGKFGLGSKSPFAYTDTFTVTAWKDGVKRMYSAFIGKGRVPQIAYMGQEPSDAPQGLEISFPVKQPDIGDFGYAALRTLYAFPQLPNLTGYKPVIPTETVLHSGDGWKLVQAVLVGQGGAYARQGCVVYPIDRNAVASKTGEQLQILTANLIIDFPIGDIDVAASRESLSYDETTCANIAKRAKEIETVILAMFTKEIQNAKTRWDATLAYKKLMASSLPTSLRDVLRQRAKWRKWKLTDYVDDGDVLDRAKGAVACCSFSSYEFNKKKLYKFEASRSMSFEPDKVVIYFQDTDAGHVHLAEARIKYDYNRNNRNANRVIWVKGPAQGRWTKALWAAFGKPPTVINVNALERPPVDKNVDGTPRKKVQAKVYDPAKHLFTDTTVDPEVGGYFVRLERGDMQYNGAAVSTSLLTDAIKALKAEKLIPDDAVVYGIPKSLDKLLSKGNAWIDFYALTATQISALYNVTAYEASYASGEAYNGYNMGSKHTRVMDFAKELTVGDIVDHTKPLAILCKLLQACKGHQKTLKEQRDYEMILSRLKVTYTIPSLVNTASAVSVMKQAVANVLNAYPMMRIAGEVAYSATFYRENKKDVLDYVNLIDAS